MANKNNFAEYISKKKNNGKKQEASEAVDFVKKHTPLMSEGDRTEFDVGETPMDLKEALNTKDASVLMTKVMEGTLEQAAEPLYIGSKLFKKINIDSGNRMVFPSLGALKATKMAEGQEYRRESLDIMLNEKSTEVTVSKKGVMVAITEEMIEDSQWEVKQKVA